MFDVSTAVAARKKLSAETNLIVLTGVFSSGDSSYGFELKSDGMGAVIYSDGFSDADEFDHEVNVETLRREIE